MRRCIVFSIGALIGLMVLVWLVNYLSVGTVVISASKNNTIVLQSTDSRKPFTKFGLGLLSATVKHGQYIATVKYGSQATVQVINVKNGHQTLHYNIGLSKVSKVEPVTYQ